MRYIFWGTFWTVAYLFLVMAPLGILLMEPSPAGRGFWWDMSSALGFAGTAMMGLMFVLTARFHHATAPFGIDIIYYFHRQIALVTLAIILAHPVIIFSKSPGLIILLRPDVISINILAGVLSLVALIILIAMSLGRKQFGIRYEGWRLWHAALAIGALALAMVHIEGVGYYINPSWKKALWMLMTAGWLVLLAYVRLIKPYILLRRPYVVEEVLREHGNTWTLALRPDGHESIKFQPGQFAWLTIWHSPFALREHPFSISSSATRPERLEFSIKELGDFTRKIKNVKSGERVYVDGPFGAFSTSRHKAPGYVFVAGGIGIAPIMGMLRTCADLDEKKPLLLIYAYKNWESLTFREELEVLREKLDLTIVYVLNEPHEGWEGETGFLTQEMLGRHLPEDFRVRDYFICGPVPMLRIAEKGLHGLGVPLRKLHSELFDLV